MGGVRQGESPLQQLALEELHPVKEQPSAEVWGALLPMGWTHTREINEELCPVGRALQLEQGMCSSP